MRYRDMRRSAGTARLAFCSCATGSITTSDLFRSPSSTWTTVRRSSGSRSKQTISPKRDLLEHADRAYWGALLTDGDDPKALAAYQVARARAEALGFTYKPANEVANLPFDDILRRMTTISDVRTPVAVETAILGGVEQPKIKVSDAFDIFCTEIRAAELAGKSEKQREQWKKVKKLAVTSFIA